jgi:hypothetical protein
MKGMCPICRTKIEGRLRWRMAVGAGESCPSCHSLLQLDARWAQKVLLVCALIAIAWIWLVPADDSVPPVVVEGLRSLLWLATLWALASGPLQVRTHRWPVAQLVVLGMLLLLGLSVALWVNAAVV